MSFSLNLLRAALPLALVASFFVGSSLLVRAQDHTSKPHKQARTLTLSAIGSINTKPDMASINTGIETEAVKARDALDDNNDVMTQMMKSLKSGGLEDRDIATTQFTVQPRYQHYKNGRPARIIGYRVSNSVRITARNIKDLGGILDQLVSLGSNRISSIQFGLGDPEKTLDEARKDAMRKALDKADLYARAANVTLGRIISISERSHHSSPRPVSFQARRSMAAVPIAPGQHTTKVTVHVKWELVD